MANYNRRVGRQTVGCDEERIPGGAAEEVRVEDGPVFFVSADEKVFVGRVSPVDANSHGAASSGVCAHAVAIRAPTSIGQRWRLPQEKKKLLTGRRPMRNWTQLFLLVSFVSPAINDADGNAVRHQTCLCAENQQKLLPPEPHFLTPICTKLFVGWGFAPQPTGGANSAPPDPPSCI